MKKLLKFCSVILFAFLFFSFFGAWHNFTNAGQGICYPCCENTDCITGADCVGSKINGDNSCKKTGPSDKPIFSGTYGQCKDPSKTTFCSFSHNKTIEDIINIVSKWTLILGLVMVPLVILFGGFYVLTAGGDTKRSGKGKQIIIWAVIALAIFLLARGLISILRYFLGF